MDQAPDRHSLAFLILNFNHLLGAIVVLNAWTEWPEFT